MTQLSLKDYAARAPKCPQATFLSEAPKERKFPNGLKAVVTVTDVSMKDKIEMDQPIQPLVWCGKERRKIVQVLRKGDRRV